MTRYFNTEGRCRPEEHYMVRLVERLELIREQYVDRGKYFVINRGRQYGKTTTLMAMAEYLKNDYIVAFMDFQGIGSEEFVNAGTFVRAFAEEFLFAVTVDAPTEREELLKPLAEFADSTADKSLRELFIVLSGICRAADRPVVLMIDEVDSAANNQVFIDFLAQLRRYYLARDRRPIFQSVILAGVYRVKNIHFSPGKFAQGRKFANDLLYGYNSPWNIAADFDMDMSFSIKQISGMLAEYEADHHTGMAVEEIAAEIYQYTSGYPYLVSAICKIMDEKLLYMEGFAGSGNIWTGTIWTKEGIQEAVRIILQTKSTLFDSMMKHISEYPKLKQMLYTMLFRGELVAYNQDNRTVELACMFGYTVSNGASVQVANRIFETRLYNLFLSEEELSSAMSQEAKQDKSQFVSGGRLDMVRVLARFVEHFQDIYGGNSDKFLESDGRKLFLLYLRPIINGTGHYYIESQTRDERRTDVIVDYAGEQFILEMKIWHGSEYNERGERQLMEYLDYYRQDKGYMLSFNFNQKKETGLKTLTFGGKMIVEAVV